LFSFPFFSATKAFTACPVSSSWMPTTAASATWSAETLASDCFVRNGRFTVPDQGILDFCRRQPMARHVDDIINPTTDPVIALVISARPIAGELSRVSLASFRVGPFE
jgi:hypothetical protein